MKHCAIPPKAVIPHVNSTIILIVVIMENELYRTKTDTIQSSELYFYDLLSFYNFCMWTLLSFNSHLFLICYRGSNPTGKCWNYFFLPHFNLLMMSWKRTKKKVWMCHYQHISLTYILFDCMPATRMVAMKREWESHWTQIVASVWHKHLMCTFMVNLPIITRRTSMCWMNKRAHTQIHSWTCTV